MQAERNSLLRCHELRNSSSPHSSAVNEDRIRASGRMGERGEGRRGEGGGEWRKEKGRGEEMGRRAA